MGDRRGRQHPQCRGSVVSRAAANVYHSGRRAAIERWAVCTISAGCGPRVFVQARRAPFGEGGARHADRLRAQARQWDGLPRSRPRVGLSAGVHGPTVVSGWVAVGAAETETCARQASGLVRRVGLSTAHRRIGRRIGLSLGAEAGLVAGHAGYFRDTQGRVELSGQGQRRFRSARDSIASPDAWGGRGAALLASRPPSALR